MVKLDLKDAYLQVPILPDHHQFLQFQWDHQMEIKMITYLGNTFNYQGITIVETLMTQARHTRDHDKLTGRSSSTQQLEVL